LKTDLFRWSLLERGIRSESLPSEENVKKIELGAPAV